jgi:protein MpaA
VLNRGLLFFGFLFSLVVYADTATTEVGHANNPNTQLNSKDICVKTLSAFSGKTDRKLLTAACAKMQQIPECHSVQGVPIYHYEKLATPKGVHKPQKILVFSLIHGDEDGAGSVVRFWLERLESISPRNSWRVVPVLNPDGVKLKTRTNFNKVDLNRNFPTKDWNEKAVTYWKKEAKQSPRRFPGPNAGSEPETLCALKQIEEFQPDLIVSIHTPLRVLDFDGPKVKPPKFEYLPWKSLGNYPGSLGRYMWFERKIPVLTMEMKEDLPTTTKPYVELQDIIGFLASLEFGQPKPKPSPSNPKK